jgi:hypothetical protein
MKALNTKLILAAFGIVAMLTGPALAQRSHHQNSHEMSSQYQTPSRSELGSVGGTDPDPQIRSELSRDAGSSVGAY